MAVTGSPRTVQAVETSMEIIEALRDLDAAGVTELSHRLDRSKGTVHSHLSTLLEYGFVSKHENQYRLSLRFIDLGEHVRERSGVYEIVQDELKSLADETGEIAHFAMEEYGRCIFVSKELGNNAAGTGSRVGRSVELHCSGVGKAMLAHMPAEQQKEIVDTHGLPRKTPHTITDPAAFSNEMETVREQGYAFDDEESILGMRCVGAPIMDSEGQVYGGVSVAGPRRRLEGEYFREQLPEAVGRVANLIEIKMRFR